MKTSLKRTITDQRDVAADFDLPIAKEDRPKLALVQQVSAPRRKKLEFWESERTRPEYTRAGDESPEYFRRAGMAYLKTCMEHPFLPVSQIRQQQFERIYGLVEMAYYDIPVYRDKYKAAGFQPVRPARLRRYPEDPGHHQARAGRGVSEPLPEPTLLSGRPLRDAVFGVFRPDAADPGGL